VLPFATLHSLAQRALEEDLSSGDLTTDATIDPAARCEARIIAKSDLVVCGHAILEACFVALDPDVQVTALQADGARAAVGSVIWTARGRTQSILQAERCALNFVQRLSGISTLTRSFVDAVPAGCKTRITDTRKTTPGLRALERYAVRVGGGYNHRDNLGSAVMIKDNHIAAAGSIATAVARARERAPHTTKVEVEVESMTMLDEALAAGAEIIMLDNFAPGDIARAVTRVAGRALVEVSGGVGLSRIAELARAGVDVISSGALTHSAPAADISLRLA
jgi:nicotinate-nucleotide pyrophosphorylase (carboxylating)